jgi:hypothetical protein
MIFINWSLALCISFAFLWSQSHALSEWLRNFYAVTLIFRNCQGTPSVRPCAMPPPSKCVLRLRAADATRWSLHTNSKISNYNQLIEPSESISISSADDIYPIESDSEIDDEAVNRVKNLILKWKDGAKPKRPVAYTKDSRTTKWRKMKQQAKRAAFAANCHLITHFLFKSSETTISADDSVDYPSDSFSDED